MPPQGKRTIERMCLLAGVSRAGYYRHWRASAPRQEETTLRDAVQKIALANRFYGYRRVAWQLERDGWCAVGYKRVRRIMREDNLLCVRRKTFVPRTTDSRHSWKMYPNLAHWLEPSAPNQLWVADITYIRLAEEFAYLAILLDAFSRRVIGWALETHLQASLALAALNMALQTRIVVSGALVHHSDRGVQYACHDYVGLLKAHGILPSMSRIACPYDNAMAESFMKTLKTEEVNGQAYRDAEAARSSIGPFLETVYNRQRLLSALSYNTPVEMEQAFSSASAIAAPNPAAVSPETGFRADRATPVGREERVLY